MEKTLEHEIELYPLASFKVLLDHEVNRSRRYKEPLTLIHLTLETEPDDPQAVHSAEVFTINILNLNLRDTDIPCKNGKEFLVLMPSTNDPGGRVACERLEQLFYAEPQTYDRVSFKLSAFIGMATASGERSLSSHKLLQNASEAMQYARTHRTNHTVIFSEMNR